MRPPLALRPSLAPFKLERHNRAERSWTCGLMRDHPGSMLARRDPIGDQDDPWKLPVRWCQIRDRWEANSSAQLSLLNVSEGARGSVPKSRERDRFGIRVGARSGACDLLRI